MAKKKTVRVELQLDDKASPELKKFSHAVRRELAEAARALKSYNREATQAGHATQRMAREATALRTTSRDLGRAAASAREYARSLREAAREAGRLRPGGVGQAGGRAGGGSGGSALSAGIIGGAVGGAASFAGAAALSGAHALASGTVSAFGDLLGAASQLQKFQIQLETVWGSTARAREEYAKLSDFAARTPFELDGLVKTQITLANLTNQTNATLEDLTRLGNAAAIVGEPVDELAVHYGRLVQGLKDNRPVGESAMRLQELGILTGETRTQLEEMIKAGTGPQGLPLFLAEFEKFDGAMDKLSRTIEGRVSTLKDTFAQFQRDLAGGGLADGFTEALAELQGYFDDNQSSIKKLAEGIGSELGGAFEDLARSIDGGPLQEALDDLVATLSGPEFRENIRATFQSIVTGSEYAVRAVEKLAGVVSSLGNQMAKNLLYAELGDNAIVASKAGGRVFELLGKAEATKGHRIAMRELSEDVGKAADEAARFVEALAQTKVAGSQEKVADVYRQLVQSQQLLNELQARGVELSGQDATMMESIAKATTAARRAMESYSGAAKLAADDVQGTSMELEDVLVPQGPAAPKMPTKAEKLQASAFKKAAEFEANAVAKEMADMFKALEDQTDNILKEAAKNAEEYAKNKEARRARRTETGVRQLEAEAAAQSARAAEPGADKSAKELAYQKEWEAQQARLDAQLEAELLELEQLNASEAEKVQVRALYAQQAYTIEEELTRRRLALAEEESKRERELLEERLGGYRTFASGMSDLLALGARESREARIAYKAAAIAEATISTYLAATKALADVSYPAGFLASAGVIASGMASVLKIQSQKFQTGGIIGQAGVYESGDRETVRLSKGEMVLNASQQRRLFSIANGQQGSRGSIVYSPQIPAGVTSAELQRVLLEDKERFAKVVRDLDRVGAGYGQR